MAYGSQKQQNDDAYRKMGIIQYYVNNVPCWQKICSEKLFCHTQATKISENKIYEQNFF